jgi:hypothetical protein
LRQDPHIAVSNANIPLFVPGPVWTSGNDAVDDPVLDLGKARSEIWVLIKC